MTRGEELATQGRRCPRRGNSVTQIATQIDGAPEQLLGLVVTACGGGRLAGPLEEVGPLGPVSAVTVSACSRKPTAWSYEPSAAARSAAALSAIRAWARERIGLGALRTFRYAAR